MGEYQACMGRGAQAQDGWGGVHRPKACRVGTGCPTADAVLTDGTQDEKKYKNMIKKY